MTDCYHIYNTRTAWLGDLLRGAAISDMVAEGQTSTPLSAMDVVILRQCWTVCEVLRADHGWPEWPHDLEAVAIEVFALAAFTLTDAARPAMPSIERTWLNFRRDVSDLLRRRFPGRPPAVWVSNVSVPQCCVPVLGVQFDRLVQLSHSCSALEVQTSNILSPTMRSRIATDRIDLFCIAAEHHDMSRACAMLLIAYIADTVTRVKGVARDINSVVAAAAWNDLRRASAIHMQFACQAIERLREITPDEVRAALEQLAGHAEQMSALAMGLHGKLGKGSSVRHANDDILRMVNGYVDNCAAARTTVLRDFST